MSDDVPGVRLSIDKDCATICFLGKWLISCSQPSLINIFSDISASEINIVSVDCKKLDKWDTSFVKNILQIDEFCKRYNLKSDFTSLPSGVVKLIVMSEQKSETEKKNLIINSKNFLKKQNVFVKLGDTYNSFKNDCNYVFDFMGKIFLSISNFFIGKAQFRRVDLVNCIQEVGVDALPIIGLISFLVGLILAFISIVQLEKFGASIYVADLIAVAMTREMGALMAAIIMAGRTGAAFASTIGSMNANDEVDALTTMGFSISDFVIMPRIIALVIMMPMLCVFSDLIGMIGGMLVSIAMTDISLSQYMFQTHASINLYDFLTGVFKSGVFGILIAGIGCLRGIQCGRSAEDVGKSTTSAVVTSMTAIVVADAIFTIIFNALGI